MPATMSGPDRLLYRTLGTAERRGEAAYHSSDYAESHFRDERSLAEDLARLEEHYRSEAHRLRDEARDALEASRACKEWRNNLSEAP